MVAVLKSLSWDWASSKEDAMIDVFFFSSSLSLLAQHGWDRPSSSQKLYRTEKNIGTKVVS